MNHIDQQTLELYVLRAGEVEELRSGIADHLASCAGCAALHSEIEQYYAAVGDIEEQQEANRSQALTVRSLLVQTPPFSHGDPLSERRKTLPARFVLFAIRHPFVSSFGFVASFAAAVFALFSVMTQTDSNPMYVRAKDDFLVVLNKEGGELWRKYIAPGFDRELLQRRSTTHAPEEYAVSVDVDGDGKNEVLYIAGMASTDDRSVYCHRHDGTLLWSYEVGRELVFGTETLANTYYPRFLEVGDMDGDGEPEVYVIAAHRTYYPNVLLKLRARDGALLGEYWHPGVLNHIRSFDLDGDGVTELILAGANNGFNLACLAVLDPRLVTGYGPAPTDYVPQGVAQGLEKYYLTFSRHDLAPFVSQKRNEVQQHVRLLSGMWELSVGELHVNEFIPLIYELNDSMDVIRVAENDLFTQLHRKLKDEGKITSTLDSAYYENLRRGVRYWDGEKFVSSPTRNKLYLEAAAASVRLP